MLNLVEKLVIGLALILLGGYAGVGYLYTMQLQGEIATGVGVIKAQEYIPQYDDLGEIPQKKKR